MYCVQCTFVRSEIRVVSQPCPSYTVPTSDMYETRSILTRCKLYSLIPDYLQVVALLILFFLFDWRTNSNGFFYIRTCTKLSRKYLYQIQITFNLNPGVLHQAPGEISSRREIRSNVKVCNSCCTAMKLVVFCQWKGGRCSIALPGLIIGGAAGSLKFLLQLRIIFTYT